MGGGPKASAANLEPLGKRRRFENLADSSSVEACASHVHEVRSVNDMAPVSSGAKDSRSAPLLSTEQTNTSHTESKLNAKWSDTAPAQVDEPGVSHPPNAEAPFSTMRTTMTGSIANIRSVKGTKDPTKRAPSPRTRLETSGALALAQEWQAKFKPLPKKPSMPNSLHEIDTREQSIRMVSEQRKLDWPDPKRLPAKKSKLKDYTSIATGKIDEESRQYRRKSGTGPQASAANLEPLGKLRRVFSPNASADRSPDPSGYQQPSAQVASVDTPALGIQKPKPDVALDAIGLSQSTEHTPEGREVLAALKQLPSKAQDFGRNAARAFQRPSSPRNDPSLFTRTKKTGNIDVFEDPLRKRGKTALATASVIGLRRGIRTRGRTSKTIVTAIDVSIRDLETNAVPIETILFMSGLMQSPTLIAEIVPHHPVGPTMTDRAIVTTFDIVETTAVTVEELIYTPARTLSADPGLTTRGASIGTVTHDTSMKYLDQLGTKVIPTNNRDHLINTFVPNTDPIFVVMAYIP
ncbi:hypothetical protein DPSP01_011008 [Paraphaeosphaeria sporulosa]